MTEKLESSYHPTDGKPIAGGPEQRLPPAGKARLTARVCLARLLWYSETQTRAVAHRRSPRRRSQFRAFTAINQPALGRDRAVRQLGTLPKEIDPKVFADYLLTLGMKTRVDEPPGRLDPLDLQ